jgi:hypothetical protein
MLAEILKSEGKKVGASLRLAGWEYLDYLTDCVYGWKRGSKWLYIGSSSFGLRRVFTHSVINVKEKVQNSDEIVVWQFPNIDLPTLLSIEMKAINAFKPLYNKEWDSTLFPKHRATKTTKEKRLERAREALKAVDDFPVKEEDFNPEDLIGFVPVKDLPDDFFLKKSTLYNWSAKKKFPELFKSIGRDLYLDLKALEELIERHTYQDKRR